MGYAAQYGFKPLVELLLEKKAPVNTQDNNGRTALHLATENNRKECVKMLLERGNAEANLTDIYGLTAGLLAGFRGQGLQQWSLFTKGAWKNRFAVEDTVAVPAVPPLPVGGGSSGGNSGNTVTSS